MKDTDVLLQDMLNAIHSIESFHVTDYGAFLADEKTQDAVMYNLIIMGEAANNIPEDYQIHHPEIPMVVNHRNQECHRPWLRPG